MTATRMIPPPIPSKNLLKTSYRTNDIVDLVQMAVHCRISETSRFAKQFTPDAAGLRKLFYWVDRHITYQEDPRDNQWVQSPAWLNRSRKGDCKSITVLISTTLTNLGVKHVIRYCNYIPGDFKHVYPVAIIDGEEIIMDVVYRMQSGAGFNQEKPYHRKKDYPVDNGLYMLGSSSNYISGDDYIGAMNKSLKTIEAVNATIPDMVDDGWGDVTQMTKGMATRMIMEDRFKIRANQTSDRTAKRRYMEAAAAMKSGKVSRVGSLSGAPLEDVVFRILHQTAKQNQPAVTAPKIAIPGPPAGVSGFFKNLWKKVKNGVSKFLKGFTNWLFKGMAKNMGPFFLFKFFTKGVKSLKIRKRQAEQQKTVNLIQRVGNYDTEQLDGLFLNGILEKTGRSPKQLAEEAGAPQIAGLAAVVPVVLKAIGVVVQVVKKIFSLFKRNPNEAGRIDDTTMSDPRLLEEEARLQAARNNQGEPSEGGFSPLLIAAGGLLLTAAL